MPRLQRRSFAEPEETRRFPHGTVRTVALDEVVFGEYRFEPGWKWSTVIKPIAGTPLCQHRHIGYALGGQLHVSMADGTTMDFFAGDAYEIPPGHDAWVVGDQTWVAVEFSGARTFGIAPGEFGAGSIVATLRVHGHRRLDGDARPRRRRRLARDAPRAQRRRAVRAGAAPRPGAQDDGRRLPVLVRQRLARRPLRAGHGGRVAIAWARHPRRVPHRRDRAGARRRARGRGARGRARDGARGEGQVFVSWTTRDLLAGRGSPSRRREATSSRAWTGPASCSG